MPRKSTEALVTSAPSSTSATPSSRSSSLRQASAAAIGEATIAFTPRCAERITVSMFLSGDGRSDTPLHPELRRTDPRIVVRGGRGTGGDRVEGAGEPIGEKADRLL